MNNDKVFLTIWGREFDLDVIYDVYAGESVLPEQSLSLQKFLAKSDVLIENMAAVANYCINDGNAEAGGQIENIFKYVMPRSLFVPRETIVRKVALLCDYKFDFEHGLALIFENEKLSEIGTQDIL